MEEKYEYTPLYYGTPCQVKYYDAANDEYVGGIALFDFIICGCCGSKTPTDEIVADAVRAGVHWDDAVIELEWVNLSDIIKG